MRFTLSLLLLLSTSYVEVNGLPPEPLLTKRQNTDEQVIAHYSTTGQCFQYLKGSNQEKALAPCKTYCKKTNPAGAAQGIGCRGLMSKEDALKEPGLIYKDSDGNQWVAGKCECGGDFAVLATDIFDIVAQGLKQLDHIICGVLLQAFTDIAKIGVKFIPVGGEVNALKAAVEGAKTMLQNSLESKGFDGWISKACKVPKFQSDPMVFQSLTKMPDSMGKSIGCKLKDKSKCKSVSPVPDKPKA